MLQPSEHGDPTVSTPSAALGGCPRCGEDLPSHSLLIEYETDEGSAVYAECPACDDVVHPVPS